VQKPLPVAVDDPPPNRRLQLTAFGARDRWFFEIILCSAPRRQLKRVPFGGLLLVSMHGHTILRRRDDRTCVGLSYLLLIASRQVRTFFDYDLALKEKIPCRHVSNDFSVAL